MPVPKYINEASWLWAAALWSLLTDVCFLFSHSTSEKLANDIFTEVGNKLQQRRLKDFVQNFGCHLTDEYKCVFIRMLPVDTVD